MSCVIMKLYLLAEMGDKDRLSCKHKTSLEIPISLRPQGTYFFSRIHFFRSMGAIAYVTHKASLCSPSEMHRVIKVKFINDLMMDEENQFWNVVIEKCFLWGARVHATRAASSVSYCNGSTGFDMPNF